MTLTGLLYGVEFSLNLFFVCIALSGFIQFRR